MAEENKSFSENSDEEYLDSLLEQISQDGTGEKKKTEEKQPEEISEEELDEAADKKVQEMLKEGLAGMMPETGKLDKDLLDSLDSIVQEIRGEGQEKPLEEKKGKKKKAKKKKKEDNRSFAQKIKDIFFRVEVVDLEEEEKLEQKKKAEQEEKKKLAQQKKEQDQAKKQEDKKAAKAAKAEVDKKRKQAKAQKDQAKKEKKAELAAKREPEERVKLKPAFLMFMATLIAVMSLLVIVLSNTYAYQHSLNRAQNYFSSKKYEEAYQVLLGMELKEKDQMFYDQVRLLTRLDRQYDSYVNYKSLQMKKEALDALMKGMTIYYEFLDYAAAYNLTAEMEELKETLMYTLTNDYGMDEEKVKQICGLENTNDYTREIELYSLGEAK